MTTYYNYYGVEAGTTQYDVIASSNIEKTLATAFEIEDIHAESIDLSVEATEYMTDRLGLTADEVAAIKANLS